MYALRQQLEREEPFFIGQETSERWKYIRRHVDGFSINLFFFGGRTYLEASLRRQPASYDLSAYKTLKCTGPAILCWSWSSSNDEIPSIHSAYGTAAIYPLCCSCDVGSLFLCTICVRYKCERYTAVAGVAAKWLCKSNITREGRTQRGWGVREWMCCSTLFLSSCERCPWPSYATPGEPKRSPL